jgi:hypothetical protein
MLVSSKVTLEHSLSILKGFFARQTKWVLTQQKWFCSFLTQKLEADCLCSEFTFFLFFKEKFTVLLLQSILKSTQLSINQQRERERMKKNKQKVLLHNLKNRSFLTFFLFCFATLLMVRGLGKYKDCPDWLEKKDAGGIWGSGKGKKFRGMYFLFCSLVFQRFVFSKQTQGRA